MKFRFLARKAALAKPPTYDAVVVEIMRFGAFIELTDFQIQGLLHASNLSKGYARFDMKKGELQAGSKTYRLGTKVKVRVGKIDVDRRRIDFELVLDARTGRGTR